MWVHNNFHSPFLICSFSVHVYISIKSSKVNRLLTCCPFWERIRQVLRKISLVKVGSTGNSDITRVLLHKFDMSRVMN